jgi:hypothetical protein
MSDRLLLLLLLLPPLELNAQAARAAALCLLLLLLALLLLLLQLSHSPCLVGHAGWCLYRLAARPPSCLQHQHGVQPAAAVHDRRQLLRPLSAASTAAVSAAADRLHVLALPSHHLPPGC